MRYLFDSSAVFTAMELDIAGKLVGESSMDLARYELGNIVWKRGAIHKRLTVNEQSTMVNVAVKVLGGMTLHMISGHEQNILTLARNLQVSFYDASYAYFAKILDLCLVTEDVQLLNSAKGYVKAVRVNEI